MKGGIYLIQEDDKLIEMKEQLYDSENLLQKLLSKYPNLLAGDQMNSADPRRWLLISREASIASEEGGPARWSLDHLFLDQDAIPTLVEVKRSTDTRIRREVVGQMLDYAANAVMYWPIEQIQANFRKTCEEEGVNADEILNEFLQGETEENQFWEKAKTNLQAEKIRLVFVADLIPSELQRIVEFLNKQMKPAEVLAVEVKLFVGEGMKTLVPKVIGQTAEAQQKKGPKIETDERTTQLWHSYWKIASKQFPDLKMPEPGEKHPNAWFIYFYPDGLPSGVSFIHKLETGNVDLQFRGKGDSIEEFKSSLDPYIKKNMTVTTAGKSAVIRVQVPEVHRFEDMQSQRDHVLKGLTAAKELLDWFNETSKKVELDAG